VMRFRLEEQYGGRRFTKVSSPDLRGWRKSRQGVHSYSYSQSVTGLTAGESYRAQVQFRWLDSHGDTLLQVRRHSGVCTQPGDLPNLQVLGVVARPGIVPGTEAYTVNVVNSGVSEADRVAVQLVVDGATPDTTTIDLLGPGEVRAIHFTGPGCRHRVRATVDPSDAVHETAESDNSLAGGCPPQG
jgi:CARDB